MLGGSLGLMYAAANDADALAFISAAGISDATQKGAINTLVQALKTAGIWTKMHAIYPMVGGTATTHKYNLKDPRDLDAAFRLSFSGGWTHSATGALPNGSTGFANTFYTPSVSGSQNSAHLSYYSRTNSAAAQIAIGVYYTAASVDHMFHINTSTTANSGNTIVNGDGIGGIAFASGLTDTRKFFVGNRISSADQTLSLNGALNVTGTRPSTTLGILPVWIGARNAMSSINLPSVQECAFASIGAGLTATEITNFYNAVQAFNTALSRAV